MAGDPKKTLGYIALQLRSQKQAADQALVREKDAKQQEIDQANKAMSVQTINDAFKQHNANEDRKLQLAGMMGKTAENVELRKYLGELADKTKNRDITVKDENADTKQTESGRHNTVTEGQGESKIGETGRHNTVTEAQGAFNAETNRGGLQIKGPYGGLDTKFDERGLPSGTPSAPGDSEQAPVAAPANNPPSSASPNPTAATPRVRDEPVRPGVYDKAMAAAQKHRGVSQMFNDAITKTEKVPDKNFGMIAEGVHLPQGLPFGLSNIGIPGRNALQSANLSLARFFGGDPDKNPELRKQQDEINNTSEARASVQKLSQNIALELLGTTSTAPQEARVQKIIGMMGSEEFAGNRETQLKVMKEAQRLHAQIERENKYIIEHRAVPLEDLPEEAQTSATQASTAPQTQPADPNAPAASGPNIQHAVGEIARAHPEAQQGLRDFLKTLDPSMPAEQKAVQALQFLQQFMQGNTKAASPENINRTQDLPY